jgi:hypothetical protein
MALCILCFPQCSNLLRLCHSQPWTAANNRPVTYHKTVYLQAAHSRRESFTVTSVEEIPGAPLLPSLGAIHVFRRSQRRVRSQFASRGRPLLCFLSFVCSRVCLSRFFKKRSFFCFQTYNRLIFSSFFGLLIFRLGLITSLRQGFLQRWASKVTSGTLVDRGKGPCLLQPPPNLLRHLHKERYLRRTSRYPPIKAIRVPTLFRGTWATWLGRDDEPGEKLLGGVVGGTSSTYHVTRSI